MDKHKHLIFNDKNQLQGGIAESQKYLFEQKEKQAI